MIGREIIEKESWRGEASRRHLGFQEAMEFQEAPNHKNRCPSRLKYNMSIKMLILHCVFEGQITKCMK